MAYTAVDPNINSMNSADRNSAAIKAGYTGWDNYQNNKGSTQSSSGGSSGSNASWQDTVQQAIDAYKKANEPAVSTYQSESPGIQSNYEAQKANVTAQGQTLNDRYDALLKSLDTSKTKDVSAQTVITNNELGKRGLLPSSTLAQQEVTNAITPITDKYTGLTTTAALDQTTGQQSIQQLLNQLTSGETTDVNAVNNAIAQLQSGAASSGITTGSNVYSQNQSTLAAQAAQTYKEQQDKIANTLAQSQLANQTAETNSAIAKSNATQTTKYPFSEPYISLGLAGQAESSIGDKAVSDYSSNQNTIKSTQNAADLAYKNAQTQSLIQKSQPTVWQQLSSWLGL